MVAKGGVIVIHDIAHYDKTINTTIGCELVWEELRDAGYITQKLLADPNGTEAGIGIVYV